MSVFQAIDSLIEYALNKELITPYDVNYCRNKLLEILKIDEYIPEACAEDTLENILSYLCDYAVSKGIIEDSITYRDMFDTKLMGAITPMPNQVIANFKKLYQINPETATDWYYNFSIDTNYIRKNRVSKDLKWKYSSEYGDLDITINLSKPEKDPKAIAQALNNTKSNYPKCQLCIQNEGYAGRINHPSRQNHRIIPITIDNSKWGFQYSPYVYYNEHCIAFNGEHTPMKINKNTFVKLLDFIDIFPHYFIGSNADLPIVGGSILTHDHFQGGNYTFAMENASIIKQIKFDGYDDVICGILKWPLSVIRLNSSNRNSLIDLGDKILSSWRIYSDVESFIFAETDDGLKHNTITPIARKRGDSYEMDLVLRNNITTDEYPYGVYHPHEEYHHIKKENIGLIEVMGLAVLPSRLKNEMSLLKEYILNGKDISSNDKIKSHYDWSVYLKTKYTFTKENIDEIINKEIGEVFLHVLECAGVYKNIDDFDKFINFVNCH